MRPCEPVAAVANALTTAGSFRPSQVESCGNCSSAFGVTNQPILPIAPSNPILTIEPSSINACSSGVKPDGQTSTLASMSPVDIPGIIAFSSMSTISTGLPKFASISCFTISTSIAEAVQLLRAILIVSVPPALSLSLPPHAAINIAPAVNKPTTNFLLRSLIISP